MSAGSEAAAASVLARLRVLSGRAAQLESSYRVLETDLQGTADELAALKAAAPRSAPRSKTLDAATAVLTGSGPGGDLRGLLRPPPHGPYVEAMLGAATRLQLVRPDKRLALREAYYSFRDATTPLHIALPLLLLAADSRLASSLAVAAAPGPGTPAGDAGDARRTLLAGLLGACHSFYWAFLLWFFAALALREHVLRVNGARIRAWWIRGHYYSIAACAVALTWPDGAGRRAFGRRYQCWAAAQGLVFSLQNRYQRKRTYTRIALGRASAMDVAAGEATAVGGQLRLLFPMLFALQAAELGCALAVLRGARADRLWQPWAVGALLAVQGAGNFLYTAAALFEKRRAAPGIAGR